MKETIEYLILDEQRNHGLVCSALIQYLSLKKIIDFEEFKQYLDDFSLEYIKKTHPDLFE
jgi:hypothetical protein